MKHMMILTVGVCLWFSSMPSVAEDEVVGGQSLAEIARKEKERREKNKADQRQVRIITESDLPKSSTPTSSSDEVDLALTVSGLSEKAGGFSKSAEVNRPINNDVIDEDSAPTEIPREAPLEVRLRIFEQMVAAHNAETQRMDEQIEQNKVRILEIEQDLATLSAVPTLPVAPRADRRFYPGDILALTTEQQQLIEENEKLQARKKIMTDELSEKGRRAGIPPGYRRF